MTEKQDTAGLRRVDDGGTFNAGWNAALDAAIERIKKLPTENAAGTLALIVKADVLDLLRGETDPSP